MFNLKTNECESIPNQQTANMEDSIPASFAWTDKQAEGAGKTTTVTQGNAQLFILYVLESNWNYHRVVENVSTWQMDRGLTLSS